MRSIFRSERGAVAVEFALVLPLLLLMLVGIMEFGRAYNNQIALTHAAREAARNMVVNNSISGAMTHAGNTSSFLADNEMRYNFSPSSCSGTEMMEVTIDYDFDPITSFVPPMTLQGQAAMRCGG